MTTGGVVWSAGDEEVEGVEGELVAEFYVALLCVLVRAYLDQKENISGG